MIPADREKAILRFLEDQGSVRIEELSRMFGVSKMTVHRDLDRLARYGRLRKVRGGAVPSQLSPDSRHECITCHATAPRRSQVLIRFSDGSQRRACCPHCGLIALSQTWKQVVSVLVTDFLYGKTMPAQQASYVFSPSISLCCTPTVLAFGSQVDASRFQSGFGGEVMELQIALQHLQSEISLG